MLTARTFRLFLLVWTALLVIFWSYINFFGGKDLEYTGYWPQLWHPYFFGILYATVAIIPALLWNLTSARQFGMPASHVGRALLFLGLGVTSWGVGNSLWFYFNLEGTEVPYPSLADAGYTGLLPLALVAIFSLSRMLAMGPRDWLRVAWVPVAVAIVTTYMFVPETSIGGIDFGRGWGLFAPGNSFWDNLFAVLYLGSDIVNMSMAVILVLQAREYAGGLFAKPMMLLAASLASLYLGDVFFFQRVFAETYYTGDISDGLYGLFLLLMTWTFYGFMKVGEQLAAPLASDDAGGSA